MIIPNFSEIFFTHDFTDDTIPELEEAQRESREVIEKLEAAHNLNSSERDAIYNIIGGEALYSQYLGFMQGFKWAVYLFTGHKDEKTTREEA